jgi:fructose-1,6-bisphosphatase
MNNNNNHDNTVDIINNNTMWQNQLASQQNLANQTNLITQGFCSVNSNIEKAILQSQQNTASIIANDTANTQKILDMMCNNTITQLRTDLAEARLEANNAQQSTYLLSKLAPYPTPSWIVSSPYTSIYPPTTTTASS